MRTMFGAGAIRCFLKTGETKDETDQLFFFKGAEYQAAIVDNGDQDMLGDHIGFRTRPDLALQFFHKVHFVGCFQQMNIWSGHLILFPEARYVYE